jgi:hypothetical protein
VSHLPSKSKLATNTNAHFGVGALLKEEKKTISKQNAPKPDYLDKEAYVDWIPPSNQSGDGKTSLNQKLGY